MEESAVNGVCERFMYDIQAYLESKLDESIPESEVFEIAAFIGCRFSVSVVDILNERDAEWRDVWVRRKKGGNDRGTD